MIKIYGKLNDYSLKLFNDNYIWNFAGTKEKTLLDISHI